MREWRVWLKKGYHPRAVRKQAMDVNGRAPSGRAIHSKSSRESYEVFILNSSPRSGLFTAIPHAGHRFDQPN